MAVTIKDVATRAGVAVGTVSRVVNNQPDVNPKLRERVQRALKELDYRPNARAQSFARNSSPVVSFILSSVITAASTEPLKNVPTRWDAAAVAAAP